MLEGGPEDSSKYGEYLRGNATEIGDSSTIRAKTPGLETAGHAMIIKQKTFGNEKSQKSAIGGPRSKLAGSRGATNVMSKDTLLVTGQKSALAGTTERTEQL